MFVIPHTENDKLALTRGISVISTSSIVRLTTSTVSGTTGTKYEQQ